MLCPRWTAGLLVLITGLITTERAPAQPPEPRALSLDEAWTRLVGVSDALSGADANVRNKKELSAATRHLRWPEVTVDVRQQAFRKTLELPLGSLAPVAAEFGLSDPLRFVEEERRFRPLVHAMVPIYTGGQIPAVQGAASASVRQAEAELRTTSQSLIVQLVQAYFGQQLAERALTVRTDVRDGLQKHVEDAEALEREGFATKAQRLQALVARDRAEREYQRALYDLDTARALLANLLRSDQHVVTTTNLFVITTPLATVQEFQRLALSDHPQIARLRAVGDQSRQGVRLQKAAQRPQIFMFGQHDLHRKDASLTDPDWAVGIGLRYTLLSNNGRRERVRAAREAVAQADAGLREVQTQLEIGVTRAYNNLETTRSVYQLLESAIADAEENLRLQELSFREGQATSLDVIDARLALGQAQIERANAAFQFARTLAQLLEASGQTDKFTEYVRRADKVLEP